MTKTGAHDLPLAIIASILNETNSNLWILWDFIFQLNSDLISNSNLNPSGLLSRPLYKLGCTSPLSPHGNFVSKTNPSHHPSSTTSPVPVVRSQGPNHRRKNYVESQSVASAIHHQSLTIVSCFGCNFSGEVEVNPTSLVSSPCRTLAPGLYGFEIGGL
jgi:hypothetical protein